MKAALSDYLVCSGGQGVKAVLIGTRSSDPNGGESISPGPFKRDGGMTDGHCYVKMSNFSHRLIRHGPVFYEFTRSWFGGMQTCGRS